MAWRLSWREAWACAKIRGVVQAHFELHNVRVQSAEAVVEQLPRHDALHVCAALDELYCHLLPRVQIESKLHEPRRAAANNSERVRFDQALMTCLATLVSRGKAQGRSPAGGGRITDRKHTC